MANPISLPQAFSTTLNVGGGIDATQTTGIVLTSVSGLPTDGGILCFDWADTLDTAVAEYIEYTGISGNTLSGVIRAQEGISGKAHTNGAVVAGVVSQAHIKRLRDKLTGNDAVALQDTNANELLKVAQVASAVNELTITNAATGGGPILSATGGDTNIDINLVPKGTGGVKSKKRVLSAASYTTDTGTSLNCDTTDTFIVTAQAGALKLNNPSGTPTNGQTLWVAVTGTAARALTYDTQFEASAAVALPTTTVTTNRLDMGFVWIAATSKWRIVASA